MFIFTVFCDCFLRGFLSFFLSFFFFLAHGPIGYEWFLNRSIWLINHLCIYAAIVRSFHFRIDDSVNIKNCYIIEQLDVFLTCSIWIRPWSVKPRKMQEPASLMDSRWTPGQSETTALIERFQSGERPKKRRSEEKNELKVGEQMGDDWS